MLRALRVSDLAIIDEIELVLEPGFNVVTGETGAGKSILLQALDVALGGRPDVDLVRAGADEAVVEALFEDVSPGVRGVLAAAGVAGEAGDQLAVRRVIGRGGRTRAYVNGALGSLAVLRDLAPHLLKVYGQDEHQALRRVESHRDLLDTAAGLGADVEEMRARWARLARARQALAERDAAHRAGRERADLLRFQHTELEQAALVPGEDAELLGERARLVHAERLGTLAGGAEAAVYSGEGSAVDTLGRATGSIREAARLDDSLGPIRTLVEQALAELEEAGAQLGRYVRTLAPDPARLEAVERRLAELARLQKKYGRSVEDVIARREEIAHELALASEGAEGVAALTAAAGDAERDASDWATRLSAARRRAAGTLERAVESEFRQVALEEARFAVRFDGGHALGPAGIDEVEFFLAANPGEEPRPLARVASGGELSRIMLALKTVTAGDDDGATLIFDEVDAGIGGRVAEVVGRKLRELGRRRQVLSVTHLPVIAAFAQHHVVVAKRVVRGRTVSSATQLSDADRVTELARMLGGARLTREAREHAQELLRQGRGGARSAAVAGK
jgi:DNA repair protein RecN (Recombination protein N)